MKDFSTGILIGICIACSVILIFLNVTKNKTNFWSFWYPNSGFVIKEKKEGIRYGKYEYHILDAYGNDDISRVVRSNQDWEIGDTILLIKK